VIGETIERLVDGLGEEAMHAKPEWAEFSIAANICHVRDIEAEGYNVRARRLAEEDDPFMPDVDGAKLAAERDYDAQDWRAALREFAALRADTISRLDGNGSGTLEGVGRITPRDLAALMEKHDRGHLREIGVLAALARFDAARDDYLRDLVELCRIPGISATDPANVRRSAEATADLLRKYGLQNVQILEVAELPGCPVAEETAPGNQATRQPGNHEGAHPGVYADRLTDRNAPTILFYAHHDVQPVGDRTRWSHDPFDPIERDGRLFARGASDDKAGVVALVAAVASWRDDVPCNVKFFIEGEEEIGSPHLDAFLAKYRELLEADVVVLADSPNFDTGIPALTYRLRGMCQVDVEVRCLERPLHSGRGAGVVPDAVAILCEKLASLRLDESDVATLSDDERNSLASLRIDADRIRRDANLLDGVDLLVHDHIPERLWTRPAITIIAFEARPLAGAFNQILDSARARLSIRTVPDMDSRATGDAIVRELTDAQTTARVVSHAPWWRTDAKGPAYDAARKALSRGYGRDPVMQGAGGTISFVRNFADAFEGVPLILLGVEDPPCNAHSEDESLSLDDWEKCARSVIHFIAELAMLSPRAGARGLGGRPAP
jgi:acetylornithine deacetylase/succinyl-diaminopimelate desuccinylase-like protein